MTEKTKPPRRGNGQGSVRQTADGQWRAQIIVDRYATVNKAGKLVERKRTRSRICKTKRDANAAISELWREYEREKNGGLDPGLTPTLDALIDAWAEEYAKDVTPATMTCYNNGLKYFRAKLGSWRMADIGIDALQNTLDNIPHGKRTREDAKTALHLVYNYGLPRHMTGDNRNLAKYLKLHYDKTDNSIERVSLTESELAALFTLADAGDRDAQDICTLCVMGWRPNEFLNLRIEHVDLDNYVIIGGSKTEKGMNRPVPIHERVQPWVVAAIGNRTAGYVYGNPKHEYHKFTLKKWTEYHFYKCLERAGIDNPMVPAGGGTERHRITPHSCRHTFARLVKNVEGADETKKDLMGHTNIEMLRHYMDSTYAERRAVIDQIQVPKKGKEE